MQGIMIVDKPAGWTSFDAVSYTHLDVYKRQASAPTATVWLLWWKSWAARRSISSSGARMWQSSSPQQMCIRDSQMDIPLFREMAREWKRLSAG